MFFSNSSNALATWSGQDVPLAPQGIPFNLLIASSIFILNVTSAAYYRRS